MEHVYMMSGNISNLDPQGSNFPPEGQPQSDNLPPGGGPQGQYIPQGQYQPQTTESSKNKIEISELVEHASTTRELSATEPEISKPEIEPATFEPASEFITPTPGRPDSPRVKFCITETFLLASLALKKLLTQRKKLFFLHIRNL